MKCTLYNVQYTMYIVQSTLVLYGIQISTMMYIVQCTYIHLYISRDLYIYLLYTALTVERDHVCIII